MRLLTAAPPLATGAAIGWRAAPALEDSQDVLPPGPLGLGGGGGAGRGLGRLALYVNPGGSASLPLAAPEVSRKQTAALQPVGRSREPKWWVTAAEGLRGLGQGPARDCR